MYNARGYPIITPEHFRATFPEQPVEGELYAGPNSYSFVCEAIQYVSQIFFCCLSSSPFPPFDFCHLIPLQRAGDMEKWKSIQFCVFDTPEQPQMIYEKRMRIVQYCTVPSKNLRYVSFLDSSFVLLFLSLAVFGRLTIILGLLIVGNAWGEII